MRIDSSPAGASVSVNGVHVGTTPIPALQVADPSKPMETVFTLEDHFPETVSQPVMSNGQPLIYAKLEPRLVRKSFPVNSEPSDASVSLEGRPIGKTPLTVPVAFVRQSKTAPWQPQTLTISKPDHETETIVLNESTDTVPTVRLSLLKDERTYTITAANVDGAELNVEVSLDGKVVGTTPYKLAITYQRPSKTSAWPTFDLKVELPGRYKPATKQLTYTASTTVPFTLEAVTEIKTKISLPGVVMTPVGATLKFTDRESIGVLRTGDDSTSITELKQVTSYERQDMRPANRVETINSFTVTPDGQNVVFSLSSQDESGAPYSNLFIKRADDGSGGVSRLTQGSRFYDTQPFIANDGSNYMVFTSNRGERSKPDVFRVNLVENRLSGGISRLTNDSRFNHFPSYGDSNRQLYYLSVEPSFPKAEPQISSIRFDGSLPTQLPIVGEQVNNTYPEKVYFVRVDSDTQKQQIYSITADGKLETALLNQEDFKRANCSEPFASPDGQRILFVSDHTGGSDERANRDIYVVNADGSNLQRLTYNESDDWQPIWSPTEEGVVYFLSTRGGATNIWRFKLVSGR